MTICCQLSETDSHSSLIRAQAASLRPDTRPSSAMWLVPATCWGRRRLIGLPRDHHP
jgi:hypothetical protein